MNQVTINPSSGCSSAFGVQIDFDDSKSFLQKSALTPTKLTTMTIIGNSLISMIDSTEPVQINLFSRRPAYSGEVVVSDGYKVREVRKEQPYWAIYINKREIIDNNKTNFIGICRPKDIISSKESVTSDHKMDYNINTPLTKSLRCTSAGGISVWMEGIGMKKDLKSSRPPVKKCTAIVKRKSVPMKANENFLVHGVERLRINSPAKKITASVRRIETIKKVYC